MWFSTLFKNTENENRLILENASLRGENGVLKEWLSESNLERKQLLHDFRRAVGLIPVENPVKPPEGADTTPTNHIQTHQSLGGFIGSAERSLAEEALKAHQREIILAIQEVEEELRKEGTLN